MNTGFDQEAVTVRTAEDNDLEGMCELLQDLFVIERDFSPDWDKQRKGLSILITRTDCLALVAELDGKVIGMCTVQPLISTAEGGKVGLIEDVVVSRAMRRTGIGKRLLDAAVEWAIAEGMTRLQLLCDMDNRAALAFYDANEWSRTNMICMRLAPLV